MNYKTLGFQHLLILLNVNF